MGAAGMKGQSQLLGVTRNRKVEQTFWLALEGKLLSRETAICIYKQKKVLATLYNQFHSLALSLNPGQEGKVCTAETETSRETQLKVKDCCKVGFSRV